MEVSCCSGLYLIAPEAISKAGLNMSFEDVTIGLKGEVIQKKTVKKLEDDFQGTVKYRDRKEWRNHLSGRRQAQR